uniref:PGG domain-containing protein n=1 Tax=Oryza punctata TaxID=4537 RepID=A0A0E0LAN0_ORYPU
MASTAGEEDSLEWQLRKYLLLLSILVATVTYIAGLDPPGGVWLETKDGHLTGNPILPDTRHLRYNLFYYSNATAFMASLVLIILLLPLQVNGVQPRAVRGVMLVDLLFLMVAYIAGSCRGRLTTVFASLLSAAIFAYIVGHTLVAPSSSKSSDEEKEAIDTKPDGKLRLKEGRKVLMVLAIFVATITYTAGLSPPGGTWEHADEGLRAHHRAGDPVLQEGHYPRFVAFFVFNTTAFVASLAVITLLLSSRLGNDAKRLSALYVGIALALLGLMGAYAFGSSRGTDTTVTVYVLNGAVAAVLICISCLAVVKSRDKQQVEPQDSSEKTAENGEDSRDSVEKARSLILLLGTLTAAVTYQAGMDPPGGVWRDGDNGHNGGDLILPATHARRYKVFFYCNSAALVASIVVVIMAQSKSLMSRHALEAAVILDLFGLMGAYAAGSCRDVRTSIYVFALAAVIFVLVVLIYAVLHRFSPSSGGSNEDMEKLGKQRKLLLLLAILAVTITYQAGLTPPGGFWIEHADEGHHYGDSILADNYPRRYKAFFYCNATSFMASVLSIVLLVSQKLSDIAVHYCKALYFCMAVGLVGLMGAYASGTTRRFRTSIYVFALVVAVLIFAAMHVSFVHAKLKECLPNLFITTHRASDSSSHVLGEEKDKYMKKYKTRKYLMLLGILAASVTYQAGLAPPGSVWPTGGDGHTAGDPILKDTDGRRYRVFFYSNSTSFVASIVVIILLLQGIGTLPRLFDAADPLKAMRAVIVLDLLGLLVAYAAGSSREWGTSGYVLAMAVMALAYVAVYVLLSLRDSKGEEEGTGSSSSISPSSVPATAA